MKKTQKSLLIIGVLMLSIFLTSISVNAQTTLDAPELNAIESPNTDGNINLRWNSVNNAWKYEISMSIDGGNWKIIEYNWGGTSYTKNVIDDGTYNFRVRAYALIDMQLAYSEYSNTRSVEVVIEEEPPPEPIYPSNPSILINNGSLTTNSFTLTLTLSCDDAYLMQFEKSNGIRTPWTTYSTSFTITLSEDLLISNTTLKIGVVFKNNDGTTIDAGLDVVYDDIIYNVPEDDGEDGDDDDDEPYDYTLIYILVGVLGALVLTVVILTRKKKRKNKS